MKNIVLDQLTEARALIRQGHAKGSSKQHFGRRTYYCATGALDEAAGGYAQGDQRCVRLLATALDFDLTGDDRLRRAVQMFNDDHSTADVLAMFDRAIALAQDHLFAPSPLVGWWLRHLTAERGAVEAAEAERAQLAAMVARIPRADVVFVPLPAAPAEPAREPVGAGITD